jgi:hypothetical protein
VKTALPQSLRLACDLAPFYGALNRTDAEPKVGHRTVADRMVTEAKGLFQGKPTQLTASIDPGYPECLLKFMAPEPSQFKAHDWQWIAETLLNACEAEPQTMVVQLAFLLTEEKSGPHKARREFRAEWAERIFDDSLRRLMRLLSAEIDDERLTPEVRGAVHAARDAAGRWLRENAGPEGDVDDEEESPGGNV